MTIWTTPRAYIIKMDGRQTALFELAVRAKAERAYQEHLRNLMLLHG